MKQLVEENVPQAAWRTWKEHAGRHASSADLFAALTPAGNFCHLPPGGGARREVLLVWVAASWRSFSCRVSSLPPPPPPRSRARRQTTRLELVRLLRQRNVSLTPVSSTKQKLLPCEPESLQPQHLSFLFTHTSDASLWALPCGSDAIAPPHGSACTGSWRDREHERVSRQGFELYYWFESVHTGTRQLLLFNNSLKIKNVFYCLTRTNSCAFILKVTGAAAETTPGEKNNIILLRLGKNDHFISDSWIVITWDVGWF